MALKFQSICRECNTANPKKNYYKMPSKIIKGKDGLKIIATQGLKCEDCYGRKAI